MNPSFHFTPSSASRKRGMLCNITDQFKKNKLTINHHQAPLIEIDKTELSSQFRVRKCGNCRITELFIYRDIYC